MRESGRSPEGESILPDWKSMLKKIGKGVLYVGLAVGAGEAILNPEGTNGLLESLNKGRESLSQLYEATAGSPMTTADLNTAKTISAS